MKSPQRSILYVVACAAVSAALLTMASGCLKKSEKQRPYYYSEEEVDSHKEDGATVVDISNPEAVKKFMSGITFVSKTYRIEVSDSLTVQVLNNGKLLIQGKCEVGEFMINDERLIMIVDESGEQYRYTLAHNGLLTDKETYALYRPEE